MYLKRAGSECAETRSRAVLANGTYCCAFVLTMLSPSEFGFSPSLSVVDPWFFLWGGIYIRIVWGGNTEGGFCKASELCLQSRGFKSSFGGAPGEARVKERNSCGHSLYSQTFFWGDCIMSKERPKRNIIQKKYVSKPTFSLFFYASFAHKCDRSIQVCLDENA